MAYKFYIKEGIGTAIEVYINWDEVQLNHNQLIKNGASIDWKDTFAVRPMLLPGYTGLSHSISNFKKTMENETNPDGTITYRGTMRSPGNITASTNNATPITYTVTFDANGGNTPSITSKNVTYNTTYGELPTVSRSGYTFNGWYTATSGGTKITPSSTYTIAKNSILYAQWTGNAYTVAFNANGGTTPTTSKNVTYNSAYGTLPTPTKIGYAFNGWYTATNGGTKITDKSIYSIIGDQTLYAQWSPITYTIVFNANGGFGSMSNMSCNYDTEYTLTANAFTKTNYIFIGWATSANGDVIYKDKASIKNLSNTATTITLYAVWQQQGTVRIMVNNEYKTAQAYIFKDGFWLLTQPWTYSSSGWKINGG